MTYRPDIDGLRALAVSLVLLFHAGVPGFHGGFIGVDVFFVISGFLVTQLLLQESAQTLVRQLADFYARRARRILPALFLVCAVSALAAWLLCLPADLLRFGQFLRLVPLLLANLAAWFEQDYFNSMSYYKPLLHLWSIAIEEQFYLVFPLLLLGLRRAVPRYVTQVLGALWLLSFASCWWASWTHPYFNFYAPSSRAWELLLGALLVLRPVTAPRRGSGSCAALALLVLIGCAALFSAATRAPGPATLLPALATAVLLVTGQGAGTGVSRLLSARACVGVGLVSYSLYLWHWPALTFLRYVSIEPPSLALRLALLAAAGLLSFASWRTLEQPVRLRQRLAGPRHFALSMLVSAGLLGGIGVAFAQHDGWPERFAPEVQRLAASYSSLAQDAVRCAGFDAAAIRHGAICHYGAERDVTRLLVWGDSHALVMLPALQLLAHERHVAVDFAARSSCRPFFTGVSADCEAFNQNMLEALARLQPDVVVFASFWAQPADLSHPALDPAQVPAQLAELLQRTRAPGRVPCVVLDAPILDYPASYALPMARRWGRDVEFLRPLRELAYRRDPMQAPVRALAARAELRLVDLKAFLCPGSRCDVLQDGESLYRDRDHLSMAATLRLRAALQACLMPAAASEKLARP